MYEYDFLSKLRKQAIIAMFSDDFLVEHLVLKGGGLLEHAYQISSRASYDIDFSIATTFDDLDDVLRRVRATLTRSFDELGLSAFDVTLTPRPPEVTEDMRDFWGGYLVHFKLIEQKKQRLLDDDLTQWRRNAIPICGNSTNFPIEISRHEFCGSTRTFLLDGATVVGYTPEVFICEKIRAICQQMPEYHQIVRRSDRIGGRARDFFDIYEVMRQLPPANPIDFGGQEFQRLIQTVFAAKRVPLSLVAKIGVYREIHRSDFGAVLDTVKSRAGVLEFDEYVEFLSQHCALLKPLWHE
jgi:hypothetical protein